MTNTRVTNPEIFEQRYPMILHKFGLRENSGGDGFHKGGDGLLREIEFRRPVIVSILSERRVHAPRGLKGGKVLVELTNLKGKINERLILVVRIQLRCLQGKFFKF